MKITQTIELDDQDRIAIVRCLKIIDEIGDAIDCSNDTVYEYFVQAADIKGGSYTISAVHQIKDILGG